MKWCQSGYALINLGFKKVFAPSLRIPRLYYRKIVSKPWCYHSNQGGKLS
jgi:hypothetical protein